MKPDAKLDESAVRAVFSDMRWRSIFEILDEIPVSRMTLAQIGLVVNEMTRAGVLEMSLHALTGLRLFRRGPGW